MSEGEGLHCEPRQSLKPMQTKPVSQQCAMDGFRLNSFLIKTATDYSSMWWREKVSTGQAGHFLKSSLGDPVWF